jgi:hypothetical protein
MARISGTMGWFWNYLWACLTPTPKCPEAIPERVSATTRRCPPVKMIGKMVPQPM